MTNMPVKTTLLALAGLVLTAAAARAQDVAAGEVSFRKCLPCHAVGEDARNKVGPVLNGLDGRKAGTVDNYAYSEPNRSSGVIWGEATFRDYIRDPRAMIPNTKMVFSGIKNEREIANLWAYLSRHGADGKVK